jgi:probable HAF family extracellular repeat protein
MEADNRKGVDKLRNALRLRRLSRKKAVSTALVLLAAALLIWWSHRPTRQHEVIRIPRIPGAPDAHAWSMNDLGQVLLHADVNDKTRFYIWDRQAGVRHAFSLQGSSSFPPKINNAGQICGTIARVGHYLAAFFWDPCDQLHYIEVEETSVYATALNDVGQVAGYMTPDGGKTRSAFIWDRDSSVRTIDAPNMFRPMACDINNDGHVVGLCTTSADKPEVFLWAQDTGVRLLNRPGGRGMGQPSTNNHAHIVVYLLGGGSPQRLVTWREGHGWKTLAGFGEVSFMLEAINDAGQILVWEHYPGTRIAKRNFFERYESWLLTTEGERTILTNALPMGTGRFSAFDLNNHGWILGCRAEPPHDYYMLIPIKHREQDR